MVIIKRNLKGVLAEEVEREFDEYVKQNSRCPKGTVEPDSFKCADTKDKEIVSTKKSANTESPKVSTESTPDKLKNALDNVNLLKRDLFTNPLKYSEIKPVGMLDSERSKIFNKLSSNTRASTGSDTGKRFASIVKNIKSPKDFEDGLKKLSNLVQDVSLDESKNKVKPGSTKDLIKYIAAQKYRFEKTKTKSNESGNSEEIKQNLRCPKDSYEQGTFKCDPSMSKAVKNKEAKETAKQGLDKNKDLTLREKSLKQATGMMSDLSGKYEALKKELQDKKKGMSNPDSPRNKKQLREIEKKMKAVGDNMDRIQKAMDKNSRGFNSEKKKPGDGAMKRIAEQVDAEGMKKRESENKSAKDTAKAEKAIKEFNKKIDSVRGSKKMEQENKSSITLGNIRKDDDGTLLPDMKETNAIVRYLGRLDDSDPEKVISQIKKKFGGDASFPEVVYNILEDNNYHGINAILNDNGMFSKVGDANKKFEAYRKKYSFEDD